MVEKKKLKSYTFSTFDCSVYIQAYPRLLYLEFYEIVIWKPLTFSLLQIKPDLYVISGSDCMYSTGKCEHELMIFLFWKASLWNGEACND